LNRPVLEVSVEVLVSFEIPAPEDTEDDMVDYEPSLVREDMDVNMIYLSSVDYSLIGDDDVLERTFGPQNAIFKKPKDLENHLKPLYVLSPRCLLIGEP
jgi:hypothetical protein